MFIDPLFRKIHLPINSFTDYVKFVAHKTNLSTKEVQSEVDAIIEWSEEHHTPLSVTKIRVLHLRQQSSPRMYNIGDQPFKAVDTVINLGVTGTTDIKHQGHYAVHYRNIIAKASRTAGFIRHLFRNRNRNLLLPACQKNVQSILLYNSQL